MTLERLQQLGRRGVEVGSNPDLPLESPRAASLAPLVGNQAATGRPALPMTISSPLAALSTRREKWVLASWMLTRVTDLV
jgi:hypothetical protein